MVNSITQKPLPDLELYAQLWMGDKKLKNHLLQKGFTQIFEY